MLDIVLLAMTETRSPIEVGLIHKKHSGLASKEQFEHEITSLL